MRKQNKIKYKVSKPNKLFSKNKKINKKTKEISKYHNYKLNMLYMMIIPK